VAVGREVRVTFLDLTDEQGWEALKADPLAYIRELAYAARRARASYTHREPSVRDG